MNFYTPCVNGKYIHRNKYICNPVWLELTERKQKLSCKIIIINNSFIYNIITKVLIELCTYIFLNK